MGFWQNEKIEKQAAEIERLRAENEKLRAALKPFADMVDYCTGTKDDDWMDAVFKLGEVRAAAAVLKETGDETPAS